MLKRLGGFADTCLSLLLRGQHGAPAFIQRAFASLPTERFSIVRVPPYNPFVGLAPDQLMLAQVVRDLGGTAFVSSLYTQPFKVRFPRAMSCCLLAASPTSCFFSALELYNRWACCPDKDGVKFA